MKRRTFLQRSALVAGGTLLSFEERHLLARETVASAGADPKPLTLPHGSLGELKISRLICGGNLTSGFAHSRDLIYVSGLMKHYFTREKIFETWRQCESQGINTVILRFDEDELKLLSDYWYVEGGNLQWIAQCKLPKQDWKADILRAVDIGAHAVFVHGGVGDHCVAAGKIDDLANAVELIRSQGLPAGIAGHRIDVPMTVHKYGIDVDFYMKTLNAKNYWSAGPQPRHDSVWAETPEETIQFMRDVEKPWIAYKILGAGAIHPREGFTYALENGADFMCVGMFDFQVEENAALTRRILAGDLSRKRPWRA